MTRDVRHYTRQTYVRLILGGLFLLYVVGDGLIYLIYGKEAAYMGLVCISLGLAPVALIVALIGLYLWLMDWIVKKSGDQ